MSRKIYFLCSSSVSVGDRQRVLDFGKRQNKHDLLYMPKCRNDNYFTIEQATRIVVVSNSITEVNALLNMRSIRKVISEMPVGRIQVINPISLIVNSLNCSYCNVNNVFVWSLDLESNGNSTNNSHSSQTSKSEGCANVSQNMETTITQQKHVKRSLSETLEKVIQDINKAFDDSSVPNSTARRELLNCAVKIAFSSTFGSTPSKSDTNESNSKFEINLEKHQSTIVTYDNHVYKYDLKLLLL